MKQKALAILCALLMLATMCMPTFVADAQAPVKAHKAQAVKAESESETQVSNGIYNGLKYRIKNGEAIITGYTEEIDADLIVPETIDGYPVTSIAAVALYSCNKLTSISTSNVKSIGDHAFSGCEALTTVEMPHVQHIVEFAFYNCCNLTKVEMPEVENIEARAFENCTSIEFFVIPDANANYSADDAVLYNKDMTELIAYPSATGNVAIIDNVRKICDYAFFSINKITSIGMENVNEIGKYAFFGCTALESLYMPNVQIIDDYAFSRCNKIESVSMPSLQVVGIDGFCNCTALASISMPNLKEASKTSFYNTPWYENLTDEFPICWRWSAYKI